MFALIAMMKKCVTWLILLTLIMGFDLATLKMRITRTANVICDTSIGEYNRIIESINNLDIDQEKKDFLIENALNEVREKCLKLKNG